MPDTPLPSDDPYLPRRFTPVPRASRRADGWTSDRQHAFVAALTRLPSVAAAARSVGMSPGSAHRLRAAAGAQDFALAWDEALEIGLEEARSRALERAVLGRIVTVKRRGIVVGTTVRYDDRMLLAALLAMRGQASGALAHQKRLARRRERAAAEAHFGRSLGEQVEEAELAERVNAAALPFMEAERRAEERAARVRAHPGPAIRRL